MRTKTVFEPYREAGLWSWGGKKPFLDDEKIKSGIEEAHAGKFEKKQRGKPSTKDQLAGRGARGEVL